MENILVVSVVTALSKRLGQKKIVAKKDREEKISKKKNIEGKKMGCSENIRIFCDSNIL
jgi:hypothetical protein